MANFAKELKDILNLQRAPVGVKFLKAGEEVDFTGTYDAATKSRYCQALMRAGQEEKVLITAENISCPASAAGFGLKPLPEMLSSGKMLFNMGLFDSPDAGRNAMEGMTRLEQGKYAAVLLSPLENIEVEPDIVVIEALPEQLMWLSLASIYETGNRLEFNTAVFEATCVDSTVIPFVTGKLNSSLGCYGCREATDALDEENLIGIPYKEMERIIPNLQKLAAKPMKKARSKEALKSFSGCGSDSE
ncbi:DUF169 domain-containing protein [Methanohalophilus mahii]|uniref:DUF169 domain-containing protein n=1 Tax=Methanohalophilus mahii (strain ATCC 35705 / DSM 5219 / SLP) TaxID=547558 RepID=D5E6K9_METMS|nr:DUF169 domain-containing protein [Methanohalophilus mahii]ADE36797.1 protein of unknown function DUF169 [Methanohalophilus mahii DSM 5219]